jgi:heat shock protein HslJ
MKKDIKFLLVMVIGIVVLLAITGIYQFGTPTDNVPQENDYMEFGDFDDEVREKSDSTLDTLVGTWLWTGTEMNSDEGRNPQPESDDYLITFHDDGTFSAVTDCNDFHAAHFRVQNSRIAWGPVASTKKYCRDSQEQEFINLVLETESYYWDDERHEDMLYLMLPYDSGSVVFTKIDDSQER